MHILLPTLCENKCLFQLEETKIDDKLSDIGDSSKGGIKLIHMGAESQNSCFNNPPESSISKYKQLKYWQMAAATHHQYANHDVQLRKINITNIPGTTRVIQCLAERFTVAYLVFFRGRFPLECI